MNRIFDFDVYISHSSKDKPVATDLAERLRADGLRVWFDSWEVLPGDMIGLKVEGGLQNSRTLLLLMSAASLSSAWVTLERHAAMFDLNKERRLIPIRIDDSTIPDVLRQFRSIDWRNQSRDQYQALLGACRWQPETAVHAGATAARSLSFEVVQKRLWEISRPHLSHLLAVENFREDGTIIIPRQPHASKSTYIDELFIPPAVSIDLAHFFESEKRGFVLVGSSGAGKSNLMCHAFLERLQRGALCIFVSTRLLLHSSIKEFLTVSVAHRLSENWTLADLDRQLRAHDSQLIVFLDAINESSSAGGPLALLNNVGELVEDSHLLGPVQIVASCRSETWLQFCNYRGQRHPLTNPHFYSDKLGPFEIEGFSRAQDRALLYHKYSEYYSLRPRSYRNISKALKTLIKQPFMMSVIAEVYSNSTIDRKVRRIPSDLDYFTLFSFLTQRKTRDAQRLVNPTDLLRDAFPSSIAACLLAFASVVFKELTGVDPTRFADGSGDRLTPMDQMSRSGDDALSLRQLSQSPEFARFLEPFSTTSPISTFEAALQVGLFKRVAPISSASEGDAAEETRFTFFHEQYTHHQLGAVLASNRCWGRISSDSLRESEEHLEHLTHKIESLISLAESAPVLSGGLDHWFYFSMRIQAGANVDLLLPLLNSLASSPSPSVRHYVRAFLAGVLLKTLVAPDTFFKMVFGAGALRLRLEVAELFREYWPDLDPSTLRSFIENCDDDIDDLAIKRVAEILSHRFGFAPREVLAYQRAALDRLKRFPELGIALLRHRPIQQQVTFAQNFCVVAALTHIMNPSLMRELRDFLKTQYLFLLKALVSESLLGPRSLVRDFLYTKLEQSGVYQWSRAIGPRGDNDRFFVEDDDGIVQRDLLYDFLIFAPEIHNEVSAASLSYLEGESAFWKLALRMLRYRSDSIVGYVATSFVVLLLKRQPWRLPFVIESLVQFSEPSVYYFTSLLLVNLTIVDKSSVPRILDALETKILPWLLSRPTPPDSDLLGVLNIASLDLDDQWPQCERILSSLLRALDEHSGEGRIARFGAELLNASFYPDARLGARVVSLLIKENYVTNPKWRKCVHKVMAGLLARDPHLLQRTLNREYGTHQPIPRAVLECLTDELMLQRDRFIYQASWNQFIVEAFASSMRLRYYLFKILLGGLAQSNSVPDYAKEFRRFVVEATRDFLFYPRTLYTLSLEEMLLESESRRKLGGGKAWRSERPTTLLEKSTGFTAGENGARRTQ